MTIFVNKFKIRINMNQKKENKFYITTPIYYVNDLPHLGHAYTTVAADILARYHRMIGTDVFFLTGTDEHGLKIENQAKLKKKTPQELVDEISAQFSLTWDNLNISHNYFIRTTDQGHIKAVNSVLRFLYDKGYIYKSKYSGLYCLGCEQFKTENQLIDGECPEHKKKLEKISEECYSFRLSDFQEMLLKKIESDEFEIKPQERKNEILSFLKNEKLQDVAISRKKVKWGVPLPFAKDHTTYVWIDAFLNYLTGLGWDGKIPLSPLLEKGETEGNLNFWPPDLQLMSKDILRVHATIWPGMLLALGLPLPKQLFIHGFFTIDGQKMSKSLGNVIRPDEMIKKFGVDTTRFLLITACPFGRDGDISWQKIQDKYNAELVNGLGNLVSRVLAMAEKKLGGVVPAIYKTKDKNLGIKDQYQKLIADLELDQVFELLVNYGKHLDSYIEKNKVYKKEGPETEKHLYLLLEALRSLSWYLLPFMPEVADKIFSQLGLDATKEKEKSFLKAISWGGLPPGTKVKKEGILFPRIK